MKNMKQHIKQYSLPLDKIVFQLGEDKMARDECDREMPVGLDCGKFRGRGKT